MEILLQGLVDSFGLTITFRVISGGEVQLHIKGFLLGDAPHCPTSPLIFLCHLCIFLLIVASPRRSALAAPIPESNDHVT